MSRLYRSTKAVVRKIMQVISSIGFDDFSLSIYISGLIVLDRFQTAKRIALFLPAKSHDALTRLLKSTSYTLRSVMSCLISFAKLFEGFFVIDDFVIEKRSQRKYHG